MSSRKIPAYRHHKARNLAVVRLDGKDIYLGEFDSPESHSKYDQLISDWLRRREIKLPVPQDIMLCELMAKYLMFARHYYVKHGKPTREFGCISETLSQLRKSHENSLAIDFGPRALKTVRQAMVDVGWSRKYINKQIGRICRMIKWGVAEELVPVSIYQALTTVPGLKKGRTTAPDHDPVEPVADDHIDQTLKHLPDVVADMVRLQRLSGARPGEIVRLRPCDLDRTSDVWAYRPTSHKTEHHSKQRVVFFGPKAQALLIPYLNRCGNRVCFSPQESEVKRRAERHAQRRTPLNQGNRPGSSKGNGKRCALNAYTTGSYRRAIHRACEKHGIPKWSPNRIRHTAATDIRRRYGLEAAQTVLGHSNAAVTEIYAERNLALAAKIAGELG